MSTITVPTLRKEYWGIAMLRTLPPVTQGASGIADWWPSLATSVWMEGWWMHGLRKGGCVVWVRPELGCSNWFLLPAMPVHLQSTYQLSHGSGTCYLDFSFHFLRLESLYLLRFPSLGWISSQGHYCKSCKNRKSIPYWLPVKMIMNGFSYLFGFKTHCSAVPIYEFL